MTDEFDLVDKGFEGRSNRWWDQQDEGQKRAWRVLAGSGAFAVLGMPILSIITGSGGVPASKHIAAAAWLFIITLPLAGVMAVWAYALVDPPKLSGVGMAGAGALTAAVGVVLMSAIIESVGGKGLSGFYCYNDGAVYTEQCREFNELEFYTSARTGSPAQNVDLIFRAAVLTIDARGWIMGVCGAFAGSAVGYLIRRSE